MPWLTLVVSCAAELEDSHSGQQKVLEALRRNPTLLKQFRPVLEDTLEEKLESMGIKRVSSGTPMAGPHLPCGRRAFLNQQRVNCSL